MATLQQVRETQRPIGVWILTIANGLFAGLFPVISALVWIASGNAAFVFGGSVTASLLALCGMAVMGAAVGAWQGSETARRVLLWSVGLYYLLTVLSNLALLALDTLPIAVESQALGAIVRAVFWVGVTVWYFRRPSTRAWYRYRG